MRFLTTTTALTLLVPHVPQHRKPHPKDSHPMVPHHRSMEIRVDAAPKPRHKSLHYATGPYKPGHEGKPGHKVKPHRHLLRRVDATPTHPHKGKPYTGALHPQSTPAHWKRLSNFTIGSLSLFYFDDRRN
ncbi:hypothetical protein BGZ76_011728 [Entomortierella beljakovae]|nr:hypothetical protein BGZ76_011728 [Entomortierella beljakovae]